MELPTGFDINDNYEHHCTVCRPRWIDADAARARQRLALDDEVEITTDPPSTTEDERSPERGERARQVARLYQGEVTQSDEEVGGSFHIITKYNIKDIFKNPPPIYNVIFFEKARFPPIRLYSF